MIIENLQKAFNVPLVQFGEDNNILVALENIGAPTSVNDPYLAGFLLDVDINTADLAVNESVSSIYQIDVNYDDNSGSAPINRMIDLLRARFPIGSYHYFGGDCFGVDALTITNLPVSNGWAQKSISLTVSSFTAKL